MLTQYKAKGSLKLEGYCMDLYYFKKEQDNRKARQLILDWRGEDLINE